MKTIETTLKNALSGLHKVQLEGRLTGIDRERVVDACIAIKEAVDSPFIAHPITHEAYLKEANRNYDLGRSHAIGENKNVLKNLKSIQYLSRLQAGDTFKT